MLRVGLTGGIATGKSLVLARFAAAGLQTIDLDRVAHELMAPGGAAYEEIVRAFGAGILGADRLIDRKALGAIVFEDAAARQRLNSIVHPKVREAEARWIAGHDATATVAVTEAALLVESGIHLRFDRLVVAHCDEAEQVRRLRKRDGLDERAARARLAAQLPIAEKRRFAHFEVDTSGSLGEAAESADLLVAVLKRLALAPADEVRLPLERALGSLVNGPVHGPRGLAPVRLLEDIVDAGGIEMERCASMLVPPASGPWFRAATQPAPGPPPRALMVPVVLWALAGGRVDPERVVAAAASVARLTHRDPPAIAGACSFALVLHAVVAAGRLDVGDGLERWAASAARWGGARPEPLGAVLEAARSHSGEVAAARARCLSLGGDPDLAGALVGAARGVPQHEVPAALVRTVARLLDRDPRAAKTGVVPPGPREG